MVGVEKQVPQGSEDRPPSDQRGLLALEGGLL